MTDVPEEDSRPDVDGLTDAQARELLEMRLPELQDLKRLNWKTRRLLAFFEKGIVLPYLHESGTEIERLPRVLLDQMCQDHIRRFENFLRAAKTGQAMGSAVNVPETTRYLEIWKGALGKTYEELNLAQKGEVHDALDDGSYDEQLRDLGIIKGDQP